MNRNNLMAIAAMAAVAAGSAESVFTRMTSERGQRGNSLRAKAYRNWYSPWFFDIRENARGGDK